MKKMEKIQSQEVFYICLNEDESIEELLKRLISLEQEGMTHLIFRESYGDIPVESFYYKEETDEEFNNRISAEKNKKQKEEEQERLTYLKLKLKYENI